MQSPEDSRTSAPGAVEHGPLLRRRDALLSGAAGLGLLLAGCGGGGGDDALLKAAVSPVNNGAYDPELLLLLLPDGYDPNDPRVQAWIDAASENGVRILPITDAQFAQLGADALRYAGLVLPDELHRVATDELMARIDAYVFSGGNAMVVFDFGALTMRPGDGALVYPIPNSRLSTLVGVQYIMYDELLDRTTGIGPVMAKRSMLRALQVPPGKSMPYLEPKAASADGVLYLPVSPADPGGVHGYDPQQYQNVRTPTPQERSAGTFQKFTDFGSAIRGPRAPLVTSATPSSLQEDAFLKKAGKPPPPPPPAPDDPLEVYSGYVFGWLQYPSYVTRGDYSGQTLATSPNFGLIAGVRSYGAGRVMFVNLPLTYLKGRTDALMMHGYLGYFAAQVLRLSSLSQMPGGVAGMVFNWHLDSMEAQEPSLALEADGIFRRGPFSIHMTAGPDTVEIGDGLGWNLDNNPTAQALLQRLRDGGHSVGSHGGWIHDYYGLNASETNQADFLPLIAENMRSVDTVIGMSGRDYSPPEGNNPLWAMDYLESRGVVAAYFGGHTGLGVTRHYREGTLRNPALAVVPVTPNGLYATFDEFQEFNVSKNAALDWYKAMVDFSIDWNTNRMVYAHPPAAYDWRDVLKALLSYAQQKGPSLFRWYTMAQLADFAATRRNVRWTETLASNGTVGFSATHPTSLADMVWRLPKSRFQKPSVSQATATLAETTTHWLVRSKGVTTLTFSAKRV